jgi:UDP-N-acetylmuramoyl-tripeptide--D-alanyl-D-alanine ligase
VRSVSLRQIAASTGGAVEGPARLTVASVGTDTRGMAARDLFIALKGERFDGHAFLDDAARAGAKAALVARRNAHLDEFRQTHTGFPLVVVKDTLKAMGDLAAFVREGLDVTTAGITGTSGKTNTKDYLVAALRATRGVAASPGSYNNEVGIPLTIFEVKKSDRALVVEMGARHPGDIRRLAEIVKPDFGVITNVGPGHLELFKTVEAVARAKAELAMALPPTGTAVLNADDRWSRAMARKAVARVVRFGFGRGADYRATRVELDSLGRPTFVLKGPGFTEEVSLPGTGRQQVANALAAAACAHVMGVGPAEIISGLSSATLSGWRLEVVEANGFLVINDSYNANPGSMDAALETLRDVGAGRRTIAVLGRMAELGAGSRSYHEEAGRRVASLDIDLLVTVGRGARYYAAAALAAGMPRGSIFRCDSADEASFLLGDLVEPLDVILIKASRVVGLESLAARLQGPGFGHAKLVANV